MCSSLMRLSNDRHCVNAWGAAVAARTEELLQPWYAKQRQAQQEAEVKEARRQEAARQAELQELARLQKKYPRS